MTESLATTLGPSAPLPLTQRADGWYTHTGYPVTKDGAPDWCGRCVALLDGSEFGRPRRVLYQEQRGPNGKGPTTLVRTGLCAECSRIERETRRRLRESGGEPTQKRAGGWR